MKYYLIGIKGNGMSGLALLLHDLGYYVTGSDVENRFFTDEALREKNIKILSYDKKNITDEYIYIIGMGIKNNEEFEEIKNKKYQFYFYNKFIDTFFDCVKIGVSGTHGKTTVTSMISHYLDKTKHCAIVGAGFGRGDKNYECCIFEACEYKNTFLEYKYDYLIINNIDYDHVDFFKNIEDVYLSFQKAADNAKCVIVNGDCMWARKIVHQNKISFGKADHNDIKLNIIEELDKGFVVEISHNEEKYRCNLPYTGEHNVYNFTAAFSLLITYRKVFDLQKRINDYEFPKRRMEIKKYKNNIIIDDYAHHPNEIKALLSGVRKRYKNKKIKVIFQPHTYSRTIGLKESFQWCFNDADEVYFTKTYTAREREDCEQERKVEEIFEKYKKINLAEIKRILDCDDSVILFVGAGVVNSDILFLK